MKDRLTELITQLEALREAAEAEADAAANSEVASRFDAIVLNLQDAINSLVMAIGYCE